MQSSTDGPQPASAGAGAGGGGVCLRRLPLFVFTAGQQALPHQHFPAPTASLCHTERDSSSSESGKLHASTCQGSRFLLAGTTGSRSHPEVHLC